MIGDEIIKSFIRYFKKIFFNKKRDIKNVKFEDYKEVIKELTGPYGAIEYKYDKDAIDYEIAIEEGIEWMQLGFRAEFRNMYSRQAYVLLALSIEIFIKAILLKNNIQIPATHNLKDLFSRMPRNIKKSIVDSLNINKLPIHDENDIEVEVLKTFDDYIGFINKYFIELRYDYEKITNAKITVIPILFINDLALKMFSICQEFCGMSIQIYTI